MKLIRSMMLALGALGLCLGLGCSHEAKPAVQPAVEPDEHPPLPPASGTPIGYLVDDAGELALTTDQIARLKEIDDDLAGQLAQLEGASRTPDPVPVSTRPDKGRGLGFRAAGRQFDGANGATGGGMTTFPGAPGGGAQVAQRGGYISGETLTEINQRRAHDLRDAIKRALALLDVGQQAIARRVLTDRAVDPETGQTSGDPTAGKPGEQAAH